MSAHNPNSPLGPNDGVGGGGADHARDSQSNVPTPELNTTFVPEGAIRPFPEHLLKYHGGPEDPRDLTDEQKRIVAWVKQCGLELLDPRSIEPETSNPSFIVGSYLSVGHNAFSYVLSYDAEMVDEEDAYATMLRALAVATGQWERVSDIESFVDFHTEDDRGCNPAYLRFTLDGEPRSIEFAQESDWLDEEVMSQIFRIFGDVPGRTILYEDGGQAGCYAWVLNDRVESFRQICPDFHPSDVEWCDRKMWNAEDNATGPDPAQMPFKNRDFIPEGAVQPYSRFDLECLPGPADPRELSDEQQRILTGIHNCGIDLLDPRQIEPGETDPSLMLSSRMCIDKPAFSHVFSYDAEMVDEETVYAKVVTGLAVATGQWDRIDAIESNIDFDRVAEEGVGPAYLQLKLDGVPVSVEFNQEGDWLSGEAMFWIFEWLGSVPGRTMLYEDGGQAGMYAWVPNDRVEAFRQICPSFKVWPAL